MSTENQQQDVTLIDEGKTQPAPAPAQDDDDFPLGKACDLSGEGTCEACQ